MVKLKKRELFGTIKIYVILIYFTLVLFFFPVRFSHFHEGSDPQNFDDPVRL